MRATKALPLTSRGPHPSQRFGNVVMASEYQFETRRYPVAAWQEGAQGEIKSTGISFEDYSRMSQRVHKPSNERRFPTPIWATDDRLLRELIVRFMEQRGNNGRTLPWQPGTLQERLASAKQRIISVRIPQVTVVLDRLCREYVALKRETPVTDKQRARLKELESEIEGIDTFIRKNRTDGGLAFIASIVYLYYRSGLDSVGVGAELDIKPPLVRQTLYKLHLTWKRLEGWLNDPSTRPVRKLKSPVPQPEPEYTDSEAADAYAEIVCQVEAVEAAAKAKPRELRKHGPKRTIDVQKAAELRSQGLWYSEIAKQLGCSAGALWQALLRDGLLVRTKRFAPRAKKAAA